MHYYFFEKFCKNRRPPACGGWELNAVLAVHSITVLFRLNMLTFSFG